MLAHAYTPEAIRRSIDFGVRSIEHGNLIDRATAEHVAAAGGFVVPTLVTYDTLHRFGRGLGLPEVGLSKLADVREAGLLSFEILQMAGVRSASAPISWVRCTATRRTNSCSAPRR